MRTLTYAGMIGMILVAVVACNREDVKTAAPAPSSTKPAMAFVGSKKTKVYHDLFCPLIDRIAPADWQNGEGRSIIRECRGSTMPLLSSRSLRIHYPSPRSPIRQLNLA